MLVVIGVFLLTFTGGVFSTSKPEKCKNEEPICLKHEHYTKNNPICIRTCANRTQPYSVTCEFFTGCVCDNGYVRKYDDGTGPCLRENKCATNRICPKYERFVKSSVGCPKTCGNRRVPVSKVAGACPPKKGCICDAGYVRKFDNATGPCIRASECPPIPTECGINEVPTSCDIKCPPQTCDRFYTIYDCPEPVCKPGCICRENYLRNSDNVCILAKECFDTKPLICGPNEVASKCAITCPPQSCDSIFTSYLCTEQKCSPGCNCIDGYLRNSKGNCVPSDQCFKDGSGCRGDANATQVACGSACEPTCAQPSTDRPCILLCKINACKCNPGYILTKSDGVCVKPEDCPGGNPKCGANQTHVPCKVGCSTDYCPKDDSRAIMACSAPNPCPSGCACDRGYLMLSYEDKRCVLSSECPPVKCTRPNEVWDPKPSNCFAERCGKKCKNQDQSAPRCVCKEGFLRNDSDVCVPESECPKQACNGDPNATFTSCLSACPTTCSNKDKLIACPAVCKGAGCQCKPGYVLNNNGSCIKPEECPGCNGDPNAKFTSCLSACPTTCSNKDKLISCPAVCKGAGCQCNPGYVLNNNGSCIKPEKCPGCNGDPNAKFNECPPACPNTCDNKKQNIACIAGCGPAGCDCNLGFVLNDKGLCIKPKDCPGGSPTCRANQTYVECTACATNFCPTHDNQSVISCIAPYPCPGGCVCNSGYLALSYSDPRCILASDCPPVTKPCTRPNEVWDPRPSTCFFEGCEDRGRVCDYIGIPDTPRCVCKQGYYRNKENICVPESECPPTVCGGDRNATFRACLSPCKRTCANKDQKLSCIAVCSGAGCACNPGYVYDEFGKCIKAEDCPAKPQCNGDRNATFQSCPSPCQATCDKPDGRKPCVDVCAPDGCVCKPGYLLSQETGGQCIEPNDCPGGIPSCPANETYRYCKSGCPTDYCPADDSLAIVACDPAFPCKGGCVCKEGFLKLSYADTRCVKVKDCPLVNCTRPNEIWDPSPPKCLRERCDNRNSDCDFPYQPLPKCICKPGYYRNQDEICVPASECPTQGCKGDPNASFKDCLSACPTTCANKDLNIACTDDCRPPGCVCNPGYVLSEVNGICVKIEDCPVKPECKGDRNATFQTCPSPCQATCDKPDTSGACIEVCAPDGCVCKPGYVLTQKTNGKCIDPSDCPGGLPTCPKNEKYTYCKVGCPNKYCPIDDRPSLVICDPIFPCPGGCVCKEGFLRLNTTDDRCIPVSECPPVKCTKPNEVWEPSPPKCLRERCDNRNSECDFPYQQPPKCICKPGYYRNQDDICVPASECPKPQCKGDYNATFQSCPSPCQATCDKPDKSGVCIAVCAPDGCVCKPGYVLTQKTNGKCIDPSDCPGGLPTCPKNEKYAYCKVDCPTNYCPIDDLSGLIICDPIFPCPGGCVCKEGFLRLNATDDRCIPVSECPPVKCTKPNEVWEASPPKCLRERCDNRNSECDFPSQQPPKCICKPGYYRNQDDICVPASECLCSVPDENKRTCASPNPPNSPYLPPKENINGCDCKMGYILSKLGGECIKIEDCPSDLGCNGDPNARPKQCPLPCPSTCQSPNAVPCKRLCDPIGCECKPGFILSNVTGQCILPDKCPGGNPCGSKGRFVYCKNDCPRDYCPVDDSRGIIACDPTQECLSGCICDLNHKKKSLNDPTCIVSSDCPPVPCRRPNEKFSSCPSACLQENCEDIHNQPTVCNTLVLNCEPSCICKKNHFRNATDICIPAKDCPVPKPECGFNEVAVPCRTICPPQNCEIAYTEYACTKESKICEPGCDCLPGHLRNGSGICIPNNDCPYPSTPVCGINEIARKCKRICPPQTCISKYGLFRCKENITCEPGCDCIKNYLRDESGKCIPSDKCPPVCSVPDENKRTCASPNPPNSPYLPPKENINGCDCKMGYILSKLGGECIKIEDCPSNLGCNGDPNARPKQCPLPCPSTCQSPNAVPCKRMCDPIGCECKPGFMLSNVTGKCILPDKCPGGNPCGSKGRFVYCKNDCPRDYCPVNDSRGIIACDPSPQCLSGCICKINHKKKSYHDRTCILSSDCPPVKCTRPNEEWSSCPSPCLRENCKDIHNQPTVCNTLVLNCEPSCICKKNHFRNATDICVPLRNCPC